MFSFTITTLGCKVNQYETQSVADILNSFGGVRVSPNTRAELCVINTCCITATAAKKSRQAIRKLIRKNPDSRIMILGCYSDYSPQQINDMLKDMGLDPMRCCVAGHHDDLAGRIETFLGDDFNNSYDNKLSPDTKPIPDGGLNRIYSGNNPYYIKPRRDIAVKHKAPGTRLLPAINRFENHQRAFVKIQDGCDAFCTYCVVPYTRPNVWSRDADQILSECRQLVQTGHKEIVLTGVFIGAYGRNTAIRKKWGNSPDKLPELVRKISEIDGLWKVRLSSLEPGDVSNELIEVYKNNPKAAPHLHLPLQSGSTKILKKMNRQYDCTQFCEAVDKLRNALDEPAITADIIVGFPHETDDDFNRTLEISRYCGFSKIHAFPFSPNPGTGAWLMRQQAPSQAETQKRMKKLAELEKQLAFEYRRKFIGSTVEGVVENTIRRKGFAQAMTDRYITVHFRTDNLAQLTGQVLKFKILEATDDGVNGQIIG